MIEHDAHGLTITSGQVVTHIQPRYLMLALFLLSYYFNYCIVKRNRFIGERRKEKRAKGFTCLR